MRDQQANPPQVWEVVSKVGFAIGEQAIREMTIDPGPYTMTGNTVQVTGCTDNTALNYNPFALADCGGYSYGPGNQWSWAYNNCCQYSASTGTTTGATFGISGCTDTVAINYNPLATFGCWGSTTFSGMGGSYNAYADQIAAFGANCSGATSYQFTQNCCCDYSGNTGMTTWVSSTGMTATTQTCQLSTQDILPCTNGGYISIGGGYPLLPPTSNISQFAIKADNIQIGKTSPWNPTSSLSMNAGVIVMTVNSPSPTQPNGMVKITTDGYPSTPLFCITYPVNVTYTNDHPTSPIGSISWTEDYIYVKTQAGWKRTALSSF